MYLCNMIFVTGGTGLVGSHVLLKLSERGEAFKALKRTSSSIDICKNVFTYYNAKDLFDKINWIDGDINDIQSLEDGMKDCNLILHCAAIVSFHPSDVKLMRKINIEGTSNVINVALSMKINKIGYISSIAALGRNANYDIIDEECYFKHSKLESNYAISKFYAEQEVWRGIQEGLDAVIINPSLILGPGDWSKGSSQIFQKIYNGLIYYAPGSSGYVDVNDVAESLIQLLLSNIKNNRFIINGANLTYKDCFNRIAKQLGKNEAKIKITPILKEFAWRVESIRSFITGKKPLVTKETANSAMTKSSFSSNKIKKELGFKFTEIDDTIKKYANWFLDDLK